MNGWLGFGGLGSNMGELPNPEFHFWKSMFFFVIALWVRIPFLEMKFSWKALGLGRGSSCECAVGFVVMCFLFLLFAFLFNFLFLMLWGAGGNVLWS